MNENHPIDLIRPLTVNDYNDWRTLWLEYQAFYHVSLSEDVTATTWERLLDPVEPIWGAVGVSDDKVIGIVHWIFHRTSWSKENTCYLQDLYVHPEKRGCGVGRKLIEFVKRDAIHNSSSKVYWLTHESNVNARKLYDQVAIRSGFLQYVVKL